MSTQLSWTSWFGLQQATGPNGETTSFGYDAYARPATSTSSMGVVTKYYYSDTPTSPMKYAITNGHGTRTTMDGFGRPTRVETGAASGAWGYNFSFTPASAVDAVYAACACSPLGKLWKTSQPYTSGGSASAWTVYTYDALGRTTQITLPDGSNTTYAYRGQQVTVTDPAGKWKTFTMDAFGNLTTVLEPDPTFGNVTTNYTYDALNHLTQVSMPRGSTTQTRTFNYKVGTALTGYLQSATNPENGTVSYTYSNGLLATKTDARNQQIQYSYDAYHRLTQVSHFPATGGAEDLNQRVSYYYDTNPDDPNGTFSTNTLGRLAEVKYYQSFLNEWYGYGGGPQVTQKRLQIQQRLVWQDTWGNGQSDTYPLNFDASYTYNAEAKLSAITYPNPGSTSPGPGYTYSFDSLGRPSGMMDSNNNWVVSNAVYGPANELLSLNYGNPYMAPFETRTYNNLLQLTAVTYSSVGGTQMSRTYNYLAGSNNGKISSSVDNVSGETVQYQYDSLNRLMAASTTAGPSPWGQSFTYDGFGNLTGKNVTQGSAPTLSVVVDPATNRAGGSTYDANGNQLQYSGHTLNYDVENRMVYASGSWPYGTSYYYDAGNRRVVRYDSSAFDQYGNPTSYLVYFNGADGKWVATYQVTTSVGIGDHGTQANVSAQAVAGGNLYFGSKRLGVYDRLGSAKANSAGFYPYGEDKGTITPNDNWKFATYWRESVTGLDYAVNRWYAPGGGRFMTVDPSWSGVNGMNPQTWNRYGYSNGNPVNNNDPVGLFSDGEEPPDPSRYACVVYAVPGQVNAANRDVPCLVYSPFVLAAAALIAEARTEGIYQHIGAELSASSLPILGYEYNESSNTVDLALPGGLLQSTGFLPVAGGAILLGSNPVGWVVVGGAVIITVGYYLLPKLIDALQQPIEARGNSDPPQAQSLGTVRQGTRDADGNCDPSTGRPPQFKWQAVNKPPGQPVGPIHWHWVGWNLSIVKCLWFIDRGEGQADPGPSYTLIPGIW